MEKLFEKSEITSAPVQIFVLSFIRQILEDIGTPVDEGLVVIADDMTMARHFVETYVAKAGNGKKIERKMPEVENFEVGYKMVRERMKEEQAEAFLESRGFLPVLITGGILPRYLRTEHFFWRIREADVRVLDDDAFTTKLQGLKAYIVDNVNNILNSINAGCSKRMLTYLEWTLLCYFRDTHKLGAIEFEQAITEFEQFAEKLLQVSDDIIHASGEVREEILSQMTRYIRENAELTMVDLNEKPDRSVCKNSTIWYDDEYYYLTDDMLRKMCDTMLEIVSVNELKAILSQEKILYCDASDDYSVKIDIGCDGEKKYIRVLKLCKLYLIVGGEELEVIYRERGEREDVCRKNEGN